MTNRTKLIPRGQQGLVSKLLNGFIGASMAESPAVMTASGWQLNKDRNWELKPGEGSKQLAENLAAISAFSPTNPATAIGDKIIKSIPTIGKMVLYGLAKGGNNWARAKVLSRRMLDISTPNISLTPANFKLTAKNPTSPNNVPTAALVFKGTNSDVPLKHDYNFFTTDPKYASQYGKVKLGILGFKNPAYTEQPLVYRDMEEIHYLADYNLKSKGLSKSDIIIGKDKITNESLPNGLKLKPSKGTEYVIWNPKQWTPLD